MPVKPIDNPIFVDRRYIEESKSEDVPDFIASLNPAFDVGGCRTNFDVSVGCAFRDQPIVRGGFHKKGQHSSKGIRIGFPEPA
jgi:hypothetical protein